MAFLQLAYKRQQRVNRALNLPEVSVSRSPPQLEGMMVVLRAQGTRGCGHQSSPFRDGIKEHSMVISLLGS